MRKAERGRGRKREGEGKRRREGERGGERRDESQEEMNLAILVQLYVHSYWQAGMTMWQHRILTHLLVHILQKVLVVHVNLREVVLDGEGVVSNLYWQTILQI